MPIQLSTPMVNDGTMYINGLQLTWVSNSKIAVFPGAARNFTPTNTDSSNTTYTNLQDIVLADLPYPNAGNAAVVIDATTQGAGGIDIGTFPLAINTLYYVYVVGDSYNINQTSALISLNFSQPQLPSAQQGGYDMYRRIGAVLTDGAGNILDFYQTNNNNNTNRTMWYDTPIRVVNAGTSAVFAPISLAAYIPLGTNEIIANVSLTPTGAGNAVIFRPTVSTSAGYVSYSSAVGGVAVEASMTIPLSLLGSFDYEVTGTTSVYLSAYIDNL